MASYSASSLIMARLLKKSRYLKVGRYNLEGGVHPVALCSNENLSSLPMRRGSSDRIVELHVAECARWEQFLSYEKGLPSERSPCGAMWSKRLPTARSRFSKPSPTKLSLPL